MILLSRNTPVAFVVGAAGFIGSHLVDRLLEKGVQVVGIDNLSTGKKENLAEAGKDKNFHFINQSMAEEFDVALPRLDYAFFTVDPEISTTSYKASVDNFIGLIKKFSSKAVLISSVDLYDSHNRRNLSNLRGAEEKIARFSVENKANARVVRLTAIFGPRMHFRVEDPMVRLISAAASNQLQKETTPLDFTTRSLYISDAVSLIIKAIMHGATAQKVYDGALSHPVKVIEAKQVLLDPLWHESRGFTPTELPPWPTPNLEKTMRELVWKPTTSLVKALRETLAFFKEHPGFTLNQDDLPKETEKVKEFEKQVGSGGWNIKEWAKESPKVKAPAPKNTNSLGESFRVVQRQIILWVGVFLIVWAFFYPIASITLNALDFKGNLEASNVALSRGEFDSATAEAERARGKVRNITEVVGEVGAVGKLKFLEPKLQFLGGLLNLLDGAADTAFHQAAGGKALAVGLKAISGESEGESGANFAVAASEFDQAERELGFILSGLSNPEFVQTAPSQLQGVMKDFRTKIERDQKVAQKGKVLSLVLSQAIPAGERRSILVLLQDETTLRPSGGVVTAYAIVTFEGGKLAEIISEDTDKIDEVLSGSVELPVEFRDDLGKKVWLFGDLGLDPDFPKNAKFAQWLYARKSDERLSGVVALDLTAASRLSEVLTFDKGTDLARRVALGGDKSYAAPTLKEILSRLFYLSKENWVKPGEVLSQVLDEKHALVYLSDPILFSPLQSLGWTGLMPIQREQRVGEKDQFLALFETNTGGGHTNLFVSRSFNLASLVDEAGLASHVLTMGFSNQDSRGNALAESYKGRLRFYLPGGTRLIKALWGEKDVTKEVRPFSDFGRAGFSVALELKPGEQKSLVLEYRDLKALEFLEGKLVYRLDVVKQPGAGPDKFDYKLQFPSGWKVVSEGSQPNSGEVSFSTDLSRDRSFEVTLQK